MGTIDVRPHCIPRSWACIRWLVASSIGHARQTPVCDAGEQGSGGRCAIAPGCSWLWELWWVWPAPVPPSWRSTRRMRLCSWLRTWPLAKCRLLPALPCLAFLTARRLD